MKSQRGMALVVSLFVLIVSALLGITSFQSSQLEERMAGNHRFSVSALQSAEAGVNDMMDAILRYSYAPGSEFCENVEAVLTDTTNGPPVFSVSGLGFSYDNAVLVSDNYLSKPYKVWLTCDGNGHVIGYSRGSVVDPNDVELAARRVKVEIIPPGLDSVRSILCGSDGVIPGNSSIDGDMHCNGNVTLKIKDDSGNPAGRIDSQGTITAAGDVNLGQDASQGDCQDAICASSGAGKIPIPSAQLQIDLAKSEYFHDYTIFYDGPDTGLPNNPLYYPVDRTSTNTAGETVAPVQDNIIKILPHDGDGNCSVSDPATEMPSVSGPVDGPGQGNMIYYCPGSLQVSGNFSGITVMAEGNITHTGASTVNDTRDTLVVSGGTITLNGSNSAETYAAYFAEGDFQQNGTATVFGAIVAGGSIGSSGGLKFVARATGMIDTPVSGHLEGWVELENPGNKGDPLNFDA